MRLFFRMIFSSRALAALLFLGLASAAPVEARSPSVIWMMLDDAGIGDLGCYGNKLIQTPHVDRMAREGMLFTDAYSGSAVCAPTRCVLMTGLHTGHCRRRDNAAKALIDTFEGRPLVALKDEDFTVAELFKAQGYATSGFGKWGLGNVGTTGTPEKQGFDLWYGYYDQVHAHEYYPEFLVRNSLEEPLPGNLDGKQTQYTQDLIAAESLQWIRDHAEDPFFCYLAYTPPHSKYQIPSFGLYADKTDWPENARCHAAMMTLVDDHVGQVLALLEELDIDDDTIVFFTSDNGVNPIPMVKEFGSQGGHRGFKRDLTDGGIRAPMVVRWPGKVPAGTTSDLIWSHVDFMATAADLTGAPVPEGTDGISVLPTLLGQTGGQKKRDYLYWEFYSPSQQAVRMNGWKALRIGKSGAIQLYEINKDPEEKNNLAAEYPQVVERVHKIMEAEHVPDPYWPLVEVKPKPKRKKKGK